jgi:hypothetical protein
MLHYRTFCTSIEKKAIVAQLRWVERPENPSFFASARPGSMDFLTLIERIAPLGSADCGRC